MKRLLARRLLAALLVAVAAWLVGGSGRVESQPAPSPAASPAARATDIHKLKVVVHTGEDWGAGTDDAIWFSLGPSYEWPLVRSGEPPFQSGHTDTFVLPARGLKVEDIRCIRLRKGRDGQGGRWFLHGIEVWVNGRPLYRKLDIDSWFENGHLDWTAPDFPTASNRPAP